MAQGQWYVMREGNEHGPLTQDQLKAMARKGAITQQTKVRLEGKGWIVAAKIKGLLPATRKGSILLQTEAGQEHISKNQLKRYLDEDRIPFDRPVVSLDGGATWLRPAEAVMAIERGVEVKGFGDPTTFDAFADQKVKVFEKEAKAVSSQQQHAMLRPWQGYGLLLLVAFFIPLWVGLHDNYFGWNIDQAADGAYAPAKPLMILFLLIGIAIFPITRYAHGILRGVLVAVLGGIGTIACGLAVFWADHAGTALIEGGLFLLLYCSFIVMAVMAAGNFLRSYFPGNQTARLLAGISGIVYVVLVMLAVFRHLNTGWFGYTVTDQPSLVLWISSIALWGLLGISGLAGVLSAAGLVNVGGEGAEVKANLAHVWSTRAVMIVLVWVGIVPIWIYGSTLADPHSMSFFDFAFYELATLRGGLFLAGALFLLSSGLIDAVREHLLRIDAERKARALAAAQGQRRPAD